MNKKTLFVCGCPRSGTSAVCQLLASHPDLVLGMERYNLRAARRELSPGDFSRDRFFAVQKGDTWYSDLSQFAKHYQRQIDKFSTAEFVGDKFPRLYEHFEYIASKFLDVRVVFVVRNPIDVAESYERRRENGQVWNEDWGPFRAIDDWNRSLKAVLQWMNYIPMLIVSYDDLVQGSLKLEDLGGFLSIDPEPFIASYAALKADRPKQPSRLGPELTAQLQSKADQRSYNLVREFASRRPQYHRAWETRGKNAWGVEKYSKSDRGMLDYDVWQLQSSRYKLRGPPPADPLSGHDLMFCGSAATFGRFVNRPFTEQSGEQLKLGYLNAGIGGARPVTYLNDEALMDQLGRARVLVLELMSARGYRSGSFIPNADYTNIGLPIGPAATLIPDPKSPRFVDHVYRLLLANKRPLALLRARMECLAAYILDMKKLLSAARGSKILLYISQRPPAYPYSVNTFDAFTGGFPHFIDDKVIEILRPWADCVVEVVSSAGLPAILRNRETGEPISLIEGDTPSSNTYYPSQEMHDEACQKLVMAIQGLAAAYSANA
jgi:hypothetical protein